MAGRKNFPERKDKRRRGALERLLKGKLPESQKAQEAENIQKKLLTTQDPK